MKHLSGRRRRLSCASPRFDRAAPTIRPTTYRFRFIVIRRLRQRGIALLYATRPFVLRLRCLFMRGLSHTKVFQIPLHELDMWILWSRCQFSQLYWSFVVSELQRIIYVIDVGGSIINVAIIKLLTFHRIYPTLSCSREYSIYKLLIITKFYQVSCRKHSCVNLSTWLKTSTKKDEK